MSLAALAATAALAGATRASAQAPTSSREQPAPRRIDADAVKSLVRLADPQISPDGRSVLVVATRADYAANEMRSELVRIDTRTGARSVLVTGQAGMGHARWSPKGDRIAYLAAGQGGRQLFVMPASGGNATQATRAATGVQFFAWRPDGAAFAFASADARPSGAGIPRVGEPFEVANDHYYTTAPPMPSHLWMVPAPPALGEARRLTSGTTSLATSLGFSPISWAPDGRALVVVRGRSASPGDTDQGTVVVLDTAGGEARPLTGHAAHESAAQYSPDGTRIAYAYPRDGHPSNLDEVVVAPATGGAGEAATRAIDRHVGLVDWWPDGKSLLVGGTDGTRSALWLQPAAGGAARKLDLGAIAFVGGASVSTTGAIALVGTEPTRPAEVYVMASAGATPRRLTDFNATLASMSAGRSERLTWTAHDGLAVDGVVTYPPDWQPGRRAPLVLVIHGGPTASSTEAFTPLVQMLAARGWVVLQPNYRGSDNLGNAFQRAIANDAGEGPGRDIVAGVDALVARGVADPSRVAVSGWSYGGFMTAWLIGRYPDRWKAAVAGAAPVDLTDMYALTDLNVMRRHAITDSPFTGDNLAKYMAMSPITHLSKARAPTLVMSTTGDVRVVVTGSYKIYHALKDNGVPVQFVAFPGGGHSPADPVRALDRDRRWVDWIGRWLDATDKAASR